MIIGQLNVPCITVLKAEDDPPVGTQGQRPEAPQIAFELVQAITRQVESLRCTGGIEKSQNFLNGIDKISTDAAAVTPLIKTFQTAMFEAPYHSGKCSVSIDTCQPLRYVCSGAACVR